MPSDKGIINNTDDVVMSTTTTTTVTTTTTISTSQSTPLASKNHRNGSNHGKTRQRDRERERRIALDEAALIIECSSSSIGSSNSNDRHQQQQQSYYSLDTFNLLGVVTDPRFVQSPTNSSNTTSSSSMTNAASATSSSSSSYFDTSYYIQSLESTLSSVTGQMESLNHVLEDWSRQFTLSSDGTALGTSTTTDFMSLYTSSSGNIGTDNNDLSTKIESLLIKELPSHIQHPDVSSIRQYVEKNGTMASNFHEAILQQKQQQQNRLVRTTTTTPLTTTTTAGSSNQELVTESIASDDIVSSANNRNTTDEGIVDVSFIPLSFFDIDYDLTDPHTFQQLLLLSSLTPAQQRDASNTTATTTSNHDLWTIPENDDENIIHKLLPLVPPDHFNVYLDTIELALLQQVRNNSNQFFIESQRFGELQEMIVSLIEQVIQLQNSNQYIEKNLLQPMIIIPSCDSIRYNLRLLDITLERIEDMIYCKHGLSGVLSAHDDLTAIEQIHYARQLLNGTYTRRISDSNGNNNDNDETYNSANDSDVIIELRRLHAFKAVPDQLKQYEQLVVSNLRDELVEIFLSWSSSTGNGTNIATSIHDSMTLNDTSTAFRTSEQERIQIRVKEILNALQQCTALNKTRDTYTTRLQDVIRMTVRTTVGEFATDVVVPKGAVQSVSMGASAMTVTRFLDCLDLISEQLILLLSSASSLNEYFIAEGMILQDTITEISNGSTDKNVMESATASPLASVLATASELMAKSVSELLRLRKDAHSLATLNEMKAIWDACTLFANQVDKFGGGSHTSSIRTTLLAQAKLFVDRRHESNMSSLAAALDSERWIQCEVSAGRQDAITRLCSGLSILSTPLKRTTTNSDTDGQVLKHPELEIEGTRYKVVWSCLLVIEMILTNIATAAHFQSIATNNVSKVSELLRLFNSRTTQLVLGAGAIHSHAKLKSINAKHLSLVTQCLGVIMAIIPHIRAGLMTQLPKKQHMLLNDLDQIRKEYNEHNEKVLNKFVSIIGGIVEHSLAKTIPGTDFDARAINTMAAVGSSGTATNGEGGTVEISSCTFLEGVSTNIRKMHQVLYTLLPPDHLIDTFSRIFAFVDNKVPALFIAAANIQPIFQQQQSVVGNTNNNKSPDKGLRKGGQQQQQPIFEFPKTNEGKRQFLLEIEAMTKNLNGLEGVRPWDFVAITVIERQLEYTINAQESNQDGSTIDNDTDSNPASETVSIMSSNDDVPCTTTGMGDGNENAVPPTSSSSNTTTQTSDMEKQDTVITISSNNHNDNDQPVLPIVNDKLKDQSEGIKEIEQAHDPKVQLSSATSEPTIVVAAKSSSAVTSPSNDDDVGTNNKSTGVNESEDITTTATANLDTTIVDTSVAPLAGE